MWRVYWLIQKGENQNFKEFVLTSFFYRIDDLKNTFCKVLWYALSINNFEDGDGRTEEEGTCKMFSSDMKRNSSINDERWLFI